MIAILPLDQIPLNVYSWSLGVLAVGAVGVKGLVAYRQSHNLMTKLFSLYAIALGLSLLVYYGPAWFTLNAHILRYAVLLGYAVATMSLLIQGRILWIVVLRSRIPFLLVVLPILALAGLSWMYYWTNLHVVLTDGLFNWDAGKVSGLIDGSLLVLLMVPIGFHFASQAFGRTTAVNRLKSLSIAFAYVLVGGSDAYNDFFNQAYDTAASSHIDLLIFIILLAVAVVPWPAAKQVESSK
jgi:hypothetical protein